MLAGGFHQVPFKPPALDIPAEKASDARDASQCDALFLSECIWNRERSDMSRGTRIKHLRTLDCEVRVLHGDCLKFLGSTVFRHGEIFCCVRGAYIFVQDSLRVHVTLVTPPPPLIFCVRGNCLFADFSRGDLVMLKKGDCEYFSDIGSI